MALFLVIVGRPIMYGLALGGGKGVEQVLRRLLADTEVTLGLSGYKGIELWCTSLLHCLRANVS
jgi:isopentenyl diphosphate isomerase/L-lactate dehydrogenase-like FMN-dependent dehydrogenase